MKQLNVHTFSSKLRGPACGIHVRHDRPNISLPTTDDPAKVTCGLCTRMYQKEKRWAALPGLRVHKQHVVNSRPAMVGRDRREKARMKAAGAMRALVDVSLERLAAGDRSAMRTLVLVVAKMQERGIPLDNESALT